MTDTSGVEITNADIDTAIEMLIAEQPTVTVSDVWVELDPGPIRNYAWIRRLQDRIRARCDAHLGLQAHMWKVR